MPVMRIAPALLKKHRGYGDTEKIIICVLRGKGFL